MSSSSEKTSQLIKDDNEDFLARLPNLAPKTVGLQIWSLVENKQWAVLEKILSAAPSACTEGFQQLIGTSLSNYLRVNVSPDHPLRAILPMALPQSGTDELEFLPQQLPEDTEYRTKIVDKCSAFFGVTPEVFWKLSIDYDRQISNNPQIFDRSEPGYLAGMLNGWNQVVSSLLDKKPLTAAGIFQLHDAAIVYRSTNNRYGRVFNKTNEPFQLGFGLGWRYRKHPEVDDIALEEIRELSTWLIEIKEGNKPLICGQFDCYEMALKKDK